MNITDPIRHRARLHANAIAVIRADDSAVSYHDLDRMIDAAAARIDGIGLAAGQIAGLPITGPDEFPSLILALALARSGIASADPLVPAQNLAVHLTDAGLTKAGETAREAVRGVAFDESWVRPPPRGSLQMRPMHPGGSAICRIFASSGTTGTPKFAAISHDLIFRRVFSNFLSMGPPEPVHICAMGFGSTTGLCNVLRSFWGGGTLVLTNPAEAIAAIRRHRVNSFKIAPGSLAALVRSVPDDGVPLPSLHSIEVGGSLLSPRLHDEVRRKLCDRIVTYFGATETGGVASGPTAALSGISGAVGYVHAGVEVRAVDAEDRPLPAGVEGILRIRSGNNIAGYFGEAVPSRDVFKTGWFYSGDMGSVTADGIMTVTGRVSDFINAGGVKVSPQVIEDVLLAVPDVTDAAAFGVPDNLGVIQIWAAIVTAAPLPTAILKTVCRDKLGGNAPKFILEVERLPRNANGKVAREELVKFALTRQG